MQELDLADSFKGIKARVKMINEDRNYVQCPLLKVAMEAAKQAERQSLAAMTPEERERVKAEIKAASNEKKAEKQRV
jgi:hypothetical protein